MFTSIVRLPVSTVFVSNSRHSFFMRLPFGTTRGEQRGRRKRKRKRVPLLLFAVSRWSGSFRPLFQGRASFLAAGQGETKDKLQRRAIMWPFPPDCVHTQGTLDIGRIIGVYSSGWTTFFLFWPQFVSYCFPFKFFQDFFRSSDYIMKNIKRFSIKNCQFKRLIN